MTKRFRDFRATTFLAFAAFAAFATSMPVISAGVRAGNRPAAVTIDLRGLRPSQANIGHAEATIRGRAIEKMDATERKEYLDEHPIAIVTGPGGRTHLVDGHHLAHAVLDLAGRGVLDSRVPGHVLADLSAMDERDFWKTMQDRKWAWLFDANDQPLSPRDLPARIEAMGDDRHRSLAWLLREEGCVEDLDQPFQEFFWARFLRKHVPLGDNKADTLRTALVAAKALAHGAGPASLPGYRHTHDQPSHDQIGKKNRRRLDSLESGSGRR